MKKKILFCCILTVIIFCFAACGAGYDPPPGPGGTYKPDYNLIPEGGNEYQEIIENPILSVADFPTSQFSMHADTAAYSNLRRAILEGRGIDKNQVRIEDMVNYFKYDYTTPTDEPLAISATVSQCPWNESSHLLTVGVKSKDIEFSEIRNNIVFLIDVSGSMSGADRLPLAQSAFSMLADNLNEDDYVSIVVYAGSQRVVLDGARGSQKEIIKDAVGSLTSGGSTAGAKGIQTAFELAAKNYIEGGNNRIILATDGDFNVGVTNNSSLEEYLTSKRSEKIGFTVLGFGYGNLKDNRLETIANAAFEGNYAYIDSVLEAKKVLVDEIGGTLVTVARDVKAQIEFNPAYVKSYRLLGYENKLLTTDDWNNQDKIAGDIGAGHCITAVYEITLNTDETLPESTMDENLLKVAVRYKDPDTADDPDAVNKEIAYFVSNVTESPNEDVRFVAAIVETALLLRNSQYKGNASFNNVLSLLYSIETLDEDQYKAEFLELVILVKSRY